MESELSTYAQVFGFGLTVIGLLQGRTVYLEKKAADDRKEERVRREQLEGKVASNSMAIAQLNQIAGLTGNGFLQRLEQIDERNAARMDVLSSKLDKVISEQDVLRGIAQANADARRERAP